MGDEFDDFDMDGLIEEDEAMMGGGDEDEEAMAMMMEEAGYRWLSLRVSSIHCLLILRKRRTHVRPKRSDVTKWGSSCSGVICPAGFP